MSGFRPALLVATLLALALPAEGGRYSYYSGVKWREPPVVDSGPTDAAPPSDAVVLFDGTDMSQWKDGKKWPVEDGCFTVGIGKGHLFTKQSFGDCQLHMEWSAPTVIEGDGQQRGNSGVYFMGLYEVQILDSYNNKTYFDGQAGAVYKQTPPMVNATRPPGAWNTYDIVWTRPRFEAGEIVTPGYLTVLHNGVLVVNHFPVQGKTSARYAPVYDDFRTRGPIMLQHHGDPVRFRNIWIRELKPPASDGVESPHFVEGRTGKIFTSDPKPKP